MTTAARAKARKAIMVNGRREALMAPGETLRLATEPAQPHDPEWYQAEILDPDGRRCALAWWHRPTSTLCNRLSVCP